MPQKLLRCELRLRTHHIPDGRLPRATAALRVLGSRDPRSESLIFTGRRGAGEIREAKILGFETRGSLRYLHSQLAESLGMNNKKNSRTSPPPRLLWISISSGGPRTPPEALLF